MRSRSRVFLRQGWGCGVEYFYFCNEGIAVSTHKNNHFSETSPTKISQLDISEEPNNWTKCPVTGHKISVCHTLGGRSNPDDAREKAAMEESKRLKKTLFNDISDDTAASRDLKISVYDPDFDMALIMESRQLTQETYDAVWGHAEVKAYGGAKCCVDVPCTKKKKLWFFLLWDFFLGLFSRVFSSGCVNMIGMWNNSFYFFCGNNP